MSPRGQRGVARRRDGEQGAVIVEFAMVFIVFVTLLAGLITFGMAFAVKQSLEHGAAEAARAVVGMPDQGDAEARMDEVLGEQLDWLGDDWEVTERRWDACGGDCVRVAVTYDGPLIHLLPIDFAAPESVTSSASLRHDLRAGDAGGEGV